MYQAPLLSYGLALTAAQCNCEFKKGPGGGRNFFDCARLSLVPVSNVDPRGRAFAVMLKKDNLYSGSIACLQTDVRGGLQ